MDLKSHPCFSTQCQPTSGRIHLPVAPRCNIFCRFCARGISKSLDLPGVTQKIVSPDEALSVMDLAISLCPEIRVAGVAGPGDPLAGPESLDTLELIKSHYPQIIACLSTNGLNLEASMERLLLAGVGTLTVTVNAIDPLILAKINRGVLVNNNFIGGTRGQEILIEAQERGIKLAHKNSMIIKINSVLIPGINDKHIPTIARIAKEWGADILNIIPLIPAYELSHIKAPTKEEYASVAEKALKYLKVKMNCRRCRADACGIPGVSDYAKDIYGALGHEETFSHG